MQPTILTGVTPENPVFREEFFGPVALFFRVKDEAEAIALANDSDFGLGGSAFTKDEARGQRFASRVETGMMFVNNISWSGIVVEVGADVRTVKEGDRVGVPWLYSACGHCEYCLSAWETVCPDAQFGGYTRNGGFAEYILADPEYVARIPAGLTPQAAAPIICAGVTTYKGLKQTSARAGEWIAISGIGGLGHLAIQYAKIMGFQICAIDVADDKLALAKQLGAHVTVNASHGDPAEAVKQATGGGAHGVLITAPSLPAFKEGVGMTRRTGTCVLVGPPPGDFPLPLFDVVAKCITVRGSFVGTRQDMAEALAFSADGRVTADVELEPLSKINSIFDRLKHDDVAGRVVLDYANAAPNKNVSSAAKDRRVPVVS